MGEDGGEEGEVCGWAGEAGLGEGGEGALDCCVASGGKGRGGRGGRGDDEFCDEGVVEGGYAGAAGDLAGDVHSKFISYENTGAYIRYHNAYMHPNSRAKPLTHVSIRTPLPSFAS